MHSDLFPIIFIFPTHLFSIDAHSLFILLSTQTSSY